MSDLETPPYTGEIPHPLFGSVEQPAAFGVIEHPPIVGDLETPPVLECGVIDHPAVGESSMPGIRHTPLAGDMNTPGFGTMETPPVRRCGISHPDAVTEVGTLSFGEPEMPPAGAATLGPPPFH